MTSIDLRNGAELDFSSVELDYEGFRKLAENPHLSANERIGFPESYRSGFTRAILDDIVTKVPDLLQKEKLAVADIGPGCSHLPREFIALCSERGHRVALIDSPEMLDQLPMVEGTTIRVPGAFPINAADVAAKIGKADVIICYSVLHYVFVDTNLFTFLDAVLALIAPGGRALIGDIPNVSKRRRFFASESGRRYHRAFTGRDEQPLVTYNHATPGKIDDAVLAGLVMRAQAAGFDAYVMPQPPTLPMYNRRDDLLILSP